MNNLIVVFFFIFSLNVFGQNDSSKTGEVKIDPWIGPVSREVSFKGDKSLGEFINDNISKDVKKYLRTSKIKGKYFYLMLIDKNGKVSEVELFKVILDPEVDKEIKRVLNLTTWYPAKLVNGTPVARKVVVPITL